MTTANIRQHLHSARRDQRVGRWRAVRRQVLEEAAEYRAILLLAERRPDRADALFAALVRAEEQVDPMAYCAAVDDILAAIPNADPTSRDVLLGERAAAAQVFALRADRQGWSA